MATFIEVSVEERGEKQTAYINAETIRYVLPERDEKARIAFDAERSLIVNECAHELYNRHTRRSGQVGFDGISAGGAAAPKGVNCFWEQFADFVLIPPKRRERRLRHIVRRAQPAARRAVVTRRYSRSARAAHMLFDRLFGGLTFAAHAHAEHHLEGDGKQQQAAGNAESRQRDAKRA